MNTEELKQLLDGDFQAATFIEDNFEDVTYIGQGPLTRVFKAKSKRFDHKQEEFAVRVVLNIASMREDDIQRMLYYEQ